MTDKIYLIFLFLLVTSVAEFVMLVVGLPWWLNAFLMLVLIMSMTDNEKPRRAIYRESDLRK